MRNQHRKSNNQNTRPMRAIEARYRKAQDMMRSLRVTSASKELQKEITWTMDTIERHGFKFFPNMYIFDEVVEFERLVGKLAEDPSTKKKK